MTPSLPPPPPSLPFPWSEQATVEAAPRVVMTGLIGCLMTDLMTGATVEAAPPDGSDSRPCGCCARTRPTVPLRSTAAAARATDALLLEAGLVAARPPASHSAPCDRYIPLRTRRGRYIPLQPASRSAPRAVAAGGEAARCRSPLGAAQGGRCDERKGRHGRRAILGLARASKQLQSVTPGRALCTAAGRSFEAIARARAALSPRGGMQRYATVGSGR